jgi:hypothetical protein
MKNPFASFFHSMLERFRRRRRIPREPALSPEQFRELLIETLDDPATARMLARALLVPVFPIQGGACTIPPSDIQAGTFDCPGNYAFTGGNVGIGTASPSYPLTVTKSTTNAGTTRVSVDSPTTVTANGTNYNIGIVNSLTNQVLSSGVTDSGYRLAFRNDVYVNNTSFAGTLGSQTALEARAGMYNVAETARINYVHAGFFHIFNGYGGQGGTIGAAFGVRISSDSGPGTFTNKWDLYAASPDAKNYFAGNVGIGTTSPEAKLHVQSGNMSSDFYGTAAVESTGNTDFNIIAGASSIATLNFGDTDGNVGRIEYSNSSDSMRFFTNAAERMRIKSDGKVGVGTTTPKRPLHVNGGDIVVEGGGIGFIEAGKDDATTVLYRAGGTGAGKDYSILRNWDVGQTSPPVYTNLTLWAPRETSFPTTPREATLALVRALDDESKTEFLDLYNNYYDDEKQYGIRIAKKGDGTSFHDFVFDQYNKTTGTKTPLMILKTDTKVGIGTSTPETQLDVAGQARVKPVAYSALPAASSTIEGAIAAVTDSSTNTWGATISGGGSNHVLAYCNGTNWTVAGK